jgi:triosephosphate isomerase (TIM)
VLNKTALNNLEEMIVDKQLTSPLARRDQPLVIGNWKMNGDTRTNDVLIESLVNSAPDLLSSTAGGQLGVGVAVCPPFPYLHQVRARLQGSLITWGAQDVSEHATGAYTGDVSAAMLLDMGCRWVIVGHSERRALHRESVRVVAQKALAAARIGLTPVFCVGETLQQRQSQQVQAVIAEQLQPLLDAGDELVGRTVIAYEPVWAIGTGHTASPEQAQDVHAFIRSLLPASQQDVPLLYGGSVKPDNARSLFEMPDIDGGLIGGASLSSADFLSVIGALLPR